MTSLSREHISRVMSETGYQPFYCNQMERSVVTIQPCVVESCLETSRVETSPELRPLKSVPNDAFTCQRYSELRIQFGQSHG